MNKLHVKYTGGVVVVKKPQQQQKKDNRLSRELRSPEYQSAL